MKLITYSLFGINNFNSDNIFEFRSYVRGFYWNFRMNRLLYPEWKTHLEIDMETWNKYKNIFNLLQHNFGLSIQIGDSNDAKCKSMLWRMKPIFYDGVTHIMCRDSDAITTYREAQAVQLWLESNTSTHAIIDNPAHGGLMGGMVAFDVKKFKELTGFNDWSSMVGYANYSNHGSDQDFLNKVIHPKVKDSCLFHINPNYKNEIPTNKKFWESNLTCRHIGSAGVVEMELLRFFKRFDDKNEMFKEIEKQYPEIFYWQLT